LGPKLLLVELNWLPNSRSPFTANPSFLAEIKLANHSAFIERQRNIVDFSGLEDVVAVS
jgi:hypothetical protein